ncbi:MAG: DNA repair protein [Xanthobacteraceae bacterium]|nr:DNA repair protein [Xanthobacteraceae bacterium]
MSPRQGASGGASGCRESGTAQPDPGTLARLRRDIGRLEGEDLAFGGEGAPRVALGHAGADAALQGGLPRGALHEVFCGGAQAATASGFVATLAWRLAARRPLLWIRQDFSEREHGALAMTGFCELGLDPRAVVTVRAPDVEAALRIAADALACDALGAVVTETWGETRRLDLTASRRLTLAARGSGVSGLMLRIAAAPAPGAAETRWTVRAARSPPRDVWGAPLFDAQLLRNRHGPTGQWIMEWNCDACLFRDVSFPPGARAAAHSQPVAAAPADRPHQAAVGAPWRRAG